MNVCKTCGNNLINMGKTFCQNCGGKMSAEVIVVDMQKQVRRDELIAPGKILLLVASILYILLGSVGTLWALLGLTFADYLYLHMQIPSGMPWRVYFTIFLLWSCFHIGVGTVGLINRKRLETTSLLRTLGCIEIGLAVLALLLAKVVLFAANIVDIIDVFFIVAIGSILAVLYLIGAFKNLKAYRNNLDS